MAAGDAMLRGFPVPTEVPPHEDVYHPTWVPAPPTTDKEIFPASSAQKLFRSDEADVGAVGTAITVTATD